MKVYIVIVNLILLFVIQDCIAQKKEALSKPYHSSLTKATVKAYLDDLHANTGLIIEYSSSILLLDNMIETDGSEATVGQLLQKVLKGQKVRLVEKNNKLLLAPASSPINVDDLVNSYIVFGFIKEGEGKEPMPDATINEVGNQKMILTNAHGYFSMMMPEGKHYLLITYTGYASKMVEVTLHSNARMDIEMSPNPALQEVIITSDNPLRKNGADKIPGDLNDTYNYFLGENDPVRSVYLLPGVLNIPENFSSMLVRGGGPDENLFLLDGTQVYNPSHMLGALSIVNQTALKKSSVF